MGESFVVQDQEESDSMEPAMAIMHLNPLMRTAIRRMKGMRIVQTTDEFEMQILSGILWFKVIERYPFSGDRRHFKRRDLRRGGL
jgi:hypothetical protein